MKIGRSTDTPAIRAARLFLRTQLLFCSPSTRLCGQFQTHCANFQHCSHQFHTSFRRHLFKQTMTTPTSVLRRWIPTLSHPRLVSHFCLPLGRESNGFQPTGLPYTDGAIQAPSQNALGRDPVEEDHQLHACLTPRKLVLQETYKPPKQQKELGTIQSIDFSVCGKRGICLSDAVDEKWAGFDGRDDRPSFGGDRFTIMLRLRVRLPATARTDRKD